jgi:DUF4097 and DUF4098 domain-containing protein YvlB
MEMPVTRTTVVRVATTVLSIGLLPGCWFPSVLGPLHEQTRVTTAAHAAQSAIRVETANGAVTVAQANRDDVEVVASLRAASEERLAATEVVAERLADGTLSVYVRWPGGHRKSRESCSLEIAVPEAVGVALHSANGSLTIEGLGGKAELTTSNGPIEVRRHGGSVTATTSNGSICAADVAGTLEVESSNGNITISGAADRVSARTSNGRMDLALTDEGVGPIHARTSNGEVVLHLGSAFAGELVAETTNGAIRIDDLPGVQVTKHDKSSAVLLFGSAVPQSTIRTSNGSVSIHGTGRALAEEPVISTE